MGEPIPRQDRERLEDTAAYLVRNPRSLKKLVYLDGQQAVLYRSRMNPSLGRNFEALDPLEWLARMSDHVPDPGQHRTILYCELPSHLDVSLARLTIPELHREVLARGIVAQISGVTIWRWRADALQPWRHRSWIFPRDPHFAEKAGRVLDLYARI